MPTAIVVHPAFEQIWPHAAGQLHILSAGRSETHVLRVADSRGWSRDVPQREHLTRLVALGVEVTDDELALLPRLREAFVSSGYDEDEHDDVLRGRGVRPLSHSSVGYWGASVAEFALGLTIGALRQIPQKHRSMLSSARAWEYPFEQYVDSSRFTSGTIEGKRIRIVGAGNIASRYAKATVGLGADVAAWDPFAPDPSFQLAGSRRAWSLEELVADAEIFAPMLPLTDTTRGIVTSSLIEALPAGCLVVLVTRAGICDMTAVRDRVISDEISLAADVYDVEPLPFGDPLLGRENVVHTPHIAGRTRDAGRAWAETLFEQFTDGF